MPPSRAPWVNVGAHRGRSLACAGQLGQPWRRAALGRCNRRRRVWGARARAIPLERIWKEAWEAARAARARHCAAKGRRRAAGPDGLLRVCSRASLGCRFAFDLPTAQPGPREHMIMYTITKGPSKLVTQRRTGPTQQVESKLADLKCRRQQHQHQQQHQQQTPPPPHQQATTPSQHQSHPIHAWPLSSSPAPKLVFHRINGKRPPVMSLPRSATEDNYTVAHEENVRFVFEEWQQVEQQLNDSQQGDRKSGPVPYIEKSACPELKNFVPIDLDDWWAQQFLARLENGS